MSGPMDIKANLNWHEKRVGDFTAIAVELTGVVGYFWLVPQVWRLDAHVEKGGGVARGWRASGAANLLRASNLGSSWVGKYFFRVPAMSLRF